MITNAHTCMITHMYTHMYTCLSPYVCPNDFRVKIAEVIKQDCGFPGVFGAMDAALIHMMAPAGDDRLNYAYVTTEEESKYGFVLQFVVDHRLMFRDIHLDAPKTGTRFQVFQVWEDIFMNYLHCVEETTIS